MSRALPILSLAHDPEFKALRTFGHHCLKDDWFSAPAKSSIEFCVALSPAYLILSALWGVEPYCDEHPANSFVEGLWSKDVIEIFVAEEGLAYREFNLSPVGAWWSAHFKGYRERSASQTPPRARAEADQADGVWQAALFVERESIKLVEPLRANVTAVLARGGDQYFSWVDLAGGEPDFHRIERVPPSFPHS